MYQQKFLGVRILRQINTVQRSYRLNRGHYTTIPDLNVWSEMDRFLRDKKFQGTGIAADLHSKLNFTREEIIPRWLLKFGLRADGLGYTLVIAPTDPATFPAFATDE